MVLMQQLSLYIHYHGNHFFLHKGGHIRTGIIAIPMYIKSVKNSLGEGLNSSALP